MFVLHVDTFKARAMFAPRSRAVKKPYGASLGRVQLLVNINHDHGCTLHAARCTLHAARCTLHAARCTLHAYRFLHSIETFNIFRSVQEKKENKLTSACNPQANRSSVLTNQSVRFYKAMSSVNIVHRTKW